MRPFPPEHDGETDAEGQQQLAQDFGLPAAHLLEDDDGAEYDCDRGRDYEGEENLEIVSICQPVVRKRTPAPDMPAWLSTTAGADVQFTESNILKRRKEGCQQH